MEPCGAVFQEEPDRLQVLSLNRIIREPSILQRYVQYMSERHPVSVLPKQITELLTVAFRDYALENKVSQLDCDRFFSYFRHKHIPLTSIDFSDLPISEKLLTEFLDEYRYQLNEVNIFRCSELANLDLTLFNKLVGNEMKKLIIGDRPHADERPGQPSKERIFDDDLKVTKLVLHRVHPRADAEFNEFCVNRKLSEYITHGMSKTLRYLDLSHSLIGRGSALIHLESLEILILFDCLANYPDVVSAICQLKRLRELDLSRRIHDEENDDEDIVMHGEHPDLLQQIVNKLPLLARLDISGTNYIANKLLGSSVFEARLERPFEFLGLLHTGEEIAYMRCLPAKRIAGEADEEQLLTACEAYIDRTDHLLKVLNDLYETYRHINSIEVSFNFSRSLETMLMIMDRHMQNAQIMSYATALLFTDVRKSVGSKRLNDAKVRMTIMSKVLDVMHLHKDSDVILINGSLSLLHLPDIIFEHSRVANISLVMCQFKETRPQEMGTALLNTLACQVGGEQKKFMGQQGAIEILTALIQSKIKQNHSDITLETAWSTLWNITDESPMNCARFLQCKGFEAFKDCMDLFDNKEVLRNMMGLLGNVAECQELRCQFMQVEYIKRFISLLSSSIDGIECSYNACGILAHLISDGRDFWINYLPGAPKRRRVMGQMVSAISRWPINSRRNINYRSFEPIVRLLSPHVAHAAQYWAVFALANLTRMNPAKYCEMLPDFGGLDKLMRLASAPGATRKYVRNLAAITLYQYEKFRRDKTLEGLEQCDSVNLEVVKSFRGEQNSHSDATSEFGETF